MNLVELARFLGIDYRRAARMAQRGEIPCQKVGGQMRFNRAEVTEWLQQKMGQLNRKYLAEVDAGISAHRQANPEAPIVSNLLRPEAIARDLAARTKRSVLKELVALAFETGLLYDGETLLEALIQREELRSTAMEKGIAIPHPRRPLPYAAAEPILVFANTPQGIGFGAPDGRLTDLFFMTCSPDDRHHLHVLARLCRMLNHKDLPHHLRTAQNSAEVIDLMRQSELEVIADSD